MQYELFVHVPAFIVMMKIAFARELHTAPPDIFSFERNVANASKANDPANGKKRES